MRRGLSASILLAGSLACASASPPPGGAEDREPPRLVALTPDSNSVNMRERNVTFRFDETINDRGSGAQELDRYFLVSPSDGNPRVSWHRSRIDVRPRNGFRANTAYTVTLLPGLTDLRGNAARAGASVVFSTGATIPPDRIDGVVFDWIAERPAARALIEAITPDSVRYLAQSDSVGRFTVGPLPPGSYLVRAFIDANSNRALDRAELFDTARVMAPQAGGLELRTIARDTLPARIASVALIDSVSLRVTFDRYLDPDQPPPATVFRLVASDSTVIPVLASLSPRAELAEAAAQQQATVDSLRRADSLAGKPLLPKPAVVERRSASGSSPSAPPPYTTVLLRIARPLAPVTTHRLRVSSVRSLSRREEASERTFTTPRAPVPAPVRVPTSVPVPATQPDSTRVPAATPP